MADLLDAVRAKEAKALDKIQGVQHGSMIGDMYEGLTRELLGKIIFGGIDLRVVTGKVRLPDGSLSCQMDAMVVHGEGERLPYTDHYLYPADRVLVVVEVKKNLYGDELASAYKNLQSVSKPNRDGVVHARRLSRVWRSLLLEDLPKNHDCSHYSDDRQMLAYAAMYEVMLPVRIVLGYRGFAGERALRDGFKKYLEKQGTGPLPGFGPASFPTIIACGNATLVKMNAMPYSMSHDGPSNEWIMYASVDGHVGRVLLEVIWTRIVSEYGIGPVVFGDDLEIEPLKPFLWASPMKRGDLYGWGYHVEELGAESVKLAEGDWEPVEVSATEAALMVPLFEKGEIAMRDEWFSTFVDDNSDIDLESLVQRLKLARIAVVTDDDRLILLTDFCQCVATPKGFFLGENSTGRLSRWVRNTMSENSGDA